MNLAEWLSSWLSDCVKHLLQVHTRLLLYFMLSFPHLKSSVSAPKRSLKLLDNAHHTEAFKLILTLTTTYRWFNNKVYKSYKFSHGSKVHQKNNRGPANMSEKNKKRWHVWLSCAWLHSGTKRQPILFYNRSTIHVAVSAKKDCWDSGILLPSWRDVTLLFIDSASFPVAPGANLMRTRTTSREVWPIRGERN